MSKQSKKEKRIREALAKGVIFDHPKYQPHEEPIMSLKGWKGLKEARRSKTFPPYLIIRENVRRHVKGYDHQGRYAREAMLAHKQLQKDIVDKNLSLSGDHNIRMAEDYKPNPTAHGNVGRKKQGELDHRGWLYVTYFRTHVPFEEFDLLSRIGNMKAEWNNTTLREGKELGDVAAYRRACKTNGYALDLLHKYNLPTYYIERLTEEFTPRKSKSS